MHRILVKKIDILRFIVKMIKIVCGHIAEVMR